MLTHLQAVAKVKNAIQCKQIFSSQKHFSRKLPLSRKQVLQQEIQVQVTEVVAFQ